MADLSLQALFVSSTSKVRHGNTTGGLKPGPRHGCRAACLADLLQWYLVGCNVASSQASHHLWWRPPLKALQQGNGKHALQALHDAMGGPSSSQPVTTCQ